MKKILITILLMLSLAIPNVLFAYPPMSRGWMTLIPTDLDAIDSPADTEVPSYDSATGKFEWIASGGSGDVTSVGNCDDGACLDGSDDGGTQVLFYDAQGATTLVGGNTAGAITLTLPIVTGTIYSTGSTDVAVADGGTNSSAALSNDRVMVSSAGAIIESATVTVTELGLLNGVTNALDRDFSVLDIVAADETPVAITAANVLANKFVTNKGSSSEADWTVPDIEYYAQIIFIVNEEFVEEICPVNADAHEAFDLNGTALDASDCIDSPAVVGSKMVATRMQIADGTWKWSFDTIRGAWVDTGATD